MSLAKKYGIEEEKIKLLIKDGWLSCSVTKYEEIYYHYKKFMNSGDKKTDAIFKAAEQGRVGERVVWDIIKKFE